MSGDQARHNVATDSPLLAAIGELRDAVHRLIDEQKALILSREAEPAPFVTTLAMSADVPAPVVPSPAPMTLTTVVLEPEPTPTLRRPPAPRPKEPPVMAEPAEPVAVEGGTPGQPDDPRKRLDALAKLLDKRLKPTAGAPARLGDA